MNLKFSLSLHIVFADYEVLPTCLNKHNVRKYLHLGKCCHPPFFYLFDFILHLVLSLEWFFYFTFIDHWTLCYNKDSTRQNSWSPIFIWLWGVGQARTPQLQTFSEAELRSDSGPQAGLLTTPWFCTFCTLYGLSVQPNLGTSILYNFIITITFPGGPGQ